MADSIWHDGLTLRRWRLRNFKSARNTEVALAPLTVVVGANSAGKSTLLQSIRVAAQAANSNSEFFPLNAEQIRLGTFSETRHYGVDESDPIEIGGHFHLGSPEYYTSPARYAAGAGYPRRRTRRVRDLVEDTHLDWSVTLHGEPKSQTASTQVVAAEAKSYVAENEHANFSVYAATEPSPISGFGHEAQYAGTVTELDGTTTEVIDVNIVGGFPRNYLYTEQAAEFVFWAWYDFRAQEVRHNVPRVHGARGGSAPVESEPTATDTDALAEMVTEDLQQICESITDDLWHSPALERALHVGIREYYSEHPLRLENDIQRSQVIEVLTRVVNSLALTRSEAPKVSALPEILRDSLGEAQEFLATRVQHLGPLRMDPKVVYTSSPSGHPGFIGTKGEYCASVLQNSGRLRIQNSPRMPDGSAGHSTLLGAVNRWAVHLGVAKDFSTEDRGRLGLQLTVRQRDLNLDLDLTSVGTGVSQILPVLVMCLQAPPGSLLLIEQPELHLNPGVQQRLADFLLAVAASGRQMVVETHSDYLVTRLRRRTAEDDSETTRQRIALVFAEHEGGTTNYTAVTPEADGSMTNWPAGFFDEAADDSQALLEALLGTLKR